MTINRKNCGDDSRTVRILVEQVSQVQEDVGVLQNQVNELDNAKVNKTDLANGVTKVTTNQLDAGQAQIAQTHIDATGITTNSVSTGTLTATTATFNRLVTAPEGNITSLETQGLEVTSTATVNNLNAQRANVAVKLTTPEVDTTSINTATVTASGQVQGNVLKALNEVDTPELKTVDADVTGTLDVKDLNITGSITGLNNVDVDARSITTPEINAGAITTGAIVTSGINHLVPSPHLDNNDHYTIILPSFTDTVVLKWADDGGNEVWSATVIGNGKDYEIHWGTVGQTLTVTKLYQYEGRLYIRENANGSLYYSYHTDDELGEITIMYNYTALDSVIDVEHMLVCTRLSGQISFGDFYAPSFTIETGIFEDLLVRGNLTVLGDSNLKQTNATGLDVSTTETVIDPETEEETEVKHEHFKADENGITVGFESIKWNGNDVKVCDDFTTDWIKD